VVLSHCRLDSLPQHSTPVQIQTGVSNLYADSPETPPVYPTRIPNPHSQVSRLRLELPQVIPRGGNGVHGNGILCRVHMDCSRVYWRVNRILPHHGTSLHHNSPPNSNSVLHQRPLPLTLTSSPPSLSISEPGVQPLRIVIGEYNLYGLYSQYTCI